MMLKRIMEPLINQSCLAALWYIATINELCSLIVKGKQESHCHPPHADHSGVAVFGVSIITAVVVAMFSLGALAGGRDDDDDGDEPRYAVGAEVSVKKSIYVGGEDDIQAHPRLRAQWGRVFIRGPSAGVVLYSDDKWSASAGIGLDFTSDTDRGDSPQLADMEDLSEILFGQFEMSYEDDWGELDFSFGVDILGEHDGYVAEFSYGYPVELGAWEIEPELGVGWLSKEVTQYYYGVGAADVRPDRPFYEPDAGINYAVGVSVTYRFARRHALLFEFGSDFYSSDITDSPIVDSSSAPSFDAGYIYRF